MLTRSRTSRCRRKAASFCSGRPRRTHVVEFDCETDIPGARIRMNATVHKTDALALWAAALTLIVWSSSYAAIAYGLQAFAPGELILLRFLLASCCFAIPVLLGLVRLPPRRDWPAVIVLGLIGNVGYQLSL